MPGLEGAQDGRREWKSGRASITCGLFIAADYRCLPAPKQHACHLRRSKLRRRLSRRRRQSRPRAGESAIIRHRALAAQRGLPRSGLSARACPIGGSKAARARQKERPVPTLIGPGFGARRFAVQLSSRAENLQPTECAGPARFLGLLQTSTSFPDALPAATSHVTRGAHSRQHQPMKGIPHEQSTSSR